MRKKNTVVKANESNGSIDERLLSAALDVFLEKGFAAATIDEIAGKAKSSKLTLYNHYGNKEGLFEAVVRRQNAAMLEVVTMTLPIGGPIEEFLHTMANRLYASLLLKETVGMLRILHAEAERFPKLTEYFDKAGPTKANQLLAAELEKQMELGVLEMADPILAGEQFFHLSLGEVTRRLLLGTRPALSKSETQKRIAGGIAVFLKAYAKTQRADR
ncbi:TetR/AcrR family transcriptional regulator [Granulicella sp. L60]|uniref:TetR/AcrR family transcriptional regulator n=1 Tax=Granulicella sp. L60 TaxID=1641866 RepID=UPI00131C9EE5|nr:TetR/AcrR family transcriptional regulator [Granulicella sp. L60]